MRPILLTLLLATAAQAQTQVQTQVQTKTATSLLTEITATSRATRSLSATITLTRQSSGQTALTTRGSVLLLKPNYALIQLTGDDPPRLLASDGHDLYTAEDSKSYTQVLIDAHAQGIAEPWFALPLRFFYTQSLNPFGSTPDSTAIFALLPNEGALRVLQSRGSSPMLYTERIYVDPQNRVVRTIVDFGSDPKATTSFRADLTYNRPPQRLTPASFRYTPPTSLTRKEGKPTDTMLALGDKAPDFTLPTPAGATLTLASQRLGKKATLVNFWYLNCPPCRIEFPEFERLYKQLAPKGLNIVAIDKEDEAADVQKYIHQAGLTFPVLLGGENKANSVFSSYRVTSLFPGTYLLDSEGKIVYRAVGEDLAGLKSALKAQGLE